MSLREAAAGLDEAAAWLSRHTDAWHAGSRENCEHCQEMIAAIGPMPSPDLLWRLLALEQSERARANRPSISASDRWTVWERDDFRCQECGSRRYLSIDHIVPLAAGGAHHISNYQTLCSSCNSRKGARL